MPVEELSFRVAASEDLERLVEIHFAAFPDGRGGAERERNFTANRFGPFAELIVAERAGEIVGHAFLFPLEGWFGGRAIRLGAIASVGVALEARGDGVGTALVRHLHRISDARGDAFTMLYAFRHRFYSRLGYGPTASRRRLSFDPASIPAAWRGLARALVRRPRGDDKDALHAVYARVARQSSGWFTRSSVAWERRLADERRHFLMAYDPATSGVLGYVGFELVQSDEHARVIAMVDELVAEDDVARRALLGALGGMQAQVAHIQLEVSADDPLELALSDPDRTRFGTARVEHHLGAIVGGAMVRIEDVSRAIEARGYLTDGAFDVVVEDDDDGSEEIAVSVRIRDGRAVVDAARAAPSAIRMTRAVLASVLYGGLRASDAAKLGLLRGAAPALGAADAVLALPPPLPVDPF